MEAHLLVGHVRRGWRVEELHDAAHELADRDLVRRSAAARRWSRRKAWPRSEAKGLVTRVPSGRRNEQSRREVSVDDDAFAPDDMDHAFDGSERSG